MIQIEYHRKRLKYFLGSKEIKIQDIESILTFFDLAYQTGRTEATLEIYKELINKNGQI